MTDMRMTLGGATIPKPAKITKSEEINSKTVQTLGNSIWTDYTNLSRSWTLSWELMYYADYEQIRNIYFGQMANGYPLFTFPAENISVLVKVEISKANLRYNKAVVEGFTIELQEQNAIS